MMRILFFGRLRDAAQCAEMRCAPPPHVRTMGALRDWLAERDAVLGQAVRAEGVRVARDQRFCGFDAPIEGASEIAFMSPLSGG
jgi:molybdopterin synthase sulfur carrier subunit